MLPVIRARWDAHLLTRKLRQSLATPKDKWKIDADDEGHPTLSTGDFRIVLVPRAARLFDAIHLYEKDAEIWLPLVSRIRLRGAARLRLIQDANQHFEPQKQKPRSRRRRARDTA
jgi:hypothetical protein